MYSAGTKVKACLNCWHVFSLLAAIQEKSAGQKVIHMLSSDPNFKPQKQKYIYILLLNERIQMGMVDFNTFCQFVYSGHYA